MQSDFHNKYALPCRYSPQKRTWPEKRLEKSPAWCAVDLRDGNQALPKPLSPEQKNEYFKLLTGIGFKEIEIGFPAASLDEWNFCRELITTNAIPDDVTVSVLTQAREHIIRRTMAALKGIKKAVCHVYIPTSELHDKYVLRENSKQIAARVADSIRLVRQLSMEMEGSQIGLEFSPEEFTDSHLPFVAELCDMAVELWNPQGEDKVIINLPATVERELPTHYPDMVEAFLEMFRERKRSVISLHAHNDMGGAVASAELALLAGGERVEGTLFGNGERSGNLDLITLALNLQYLGIETGLDFRELDRISAKVSRLTSMSVNPRQPYAGALVFTAFAGSHQDAIHKGLASEADTREYFHGWKVPYLHIDPKALGRSFQGSIRINSQSGKGGIAYVLSEAYGIELPEEMLARLAELVQDETDRSGAELKAARVWNILLGEYQSLEEPLKLLDYKYSNDSGRTVMELSLSLNGKNMALHSTGDGPVEAFATAVRNYVPPFRLLDYKQQSIGTTVRASSLTIIKLEELGGGCYYGVCEDFDIMQSALKAFTSALNRMSEHKNNRNN